MKENDVIWVSIEESDKIEIVISYCLQTLLENVLNF